jgi:hypothetical protein
MVISVFKGPAASSSRPQTLSPLVLLITTAITLSYVYNIFPQLASFILKKKDATGWFPLTGLVTLYLYHITSQKFIFLNNGF